MLFNSFVFLFAFLPITLLVAHVLGRRATVGKLALIAASLFFYGWWDYRFIPMLLVSIALNYAAGQFLLSSQRESWKSAVTVGTVAANLIALGFFKYSSFLGTSIEAIAPGLIGPSTVAAAADIVLPLAISFLTFHQISLLMDIRRGVVRSITLIDCSLFVVFFPHLIAGPIVRYAEIVPQFERRFAGFTGLRAQDLAPGLALFAIGLFKKVVLSDVLADIIDPAFASVAQGSAPSLVEAWTAVLGFSMRIYFDFSGYSDMALGLACMFGIRFPVNFYSPYKARNIQDFWRRWHITLSRYLRDYVYIPLGGNRGAGEARTSLNLLLTMLLGGLWHGANWTFVVWGGLHGLFLVIHRQWRRNVRSSIFAGRAWTGAAWLLTFLAVCFAWVPFRAESLHDAISIWNGMILRGGVVLPDTYAGKLGQLATLGIQFHPMPNWPGMVPTLFVLGCCLVSFLLPNSIQLVGTDATLAEDSRTIDPRLTAKLASPPAKPHSFLRSAVWIGAAIAVALAAITGDVWTNEFIYFQF